MNQLGHAALLIWFLGFVFQLICMLFLYGLLREARKNGYKEGSGLLAHRKLLKELSLQDLSGSGTRRFWWYDLFYRSCILMYFILFSILFLMYFL